MSIYAACTTELQKKKKRILTRERDAAERDKMIIADFIKLTWRERERERETEREREREKERRRDTHQISPENGRQKKKYEVKLSMKETGMHA